MLETLKQWDRELFIYLNNLGIENFDSFWLFVTQIESWIPLFLFFIALIFYFYGTKKGLLVFFLTLLCFTITITLTNFTKDYVARIRPNNVKALAEFIRTLQAPNNFSFFSGHASSSFAITTFVVLSLRQFNKWIVLAYLWPILFVLSRIFVGVHYPSDLFVGALVGTSIALGMHWVSKKALKRI